MDPGDASAQRLRARTERAEALAAAREEEAAAARRELERLRVRLATVEARAARTREADQRLGLLELTVHAASAEVARAEASRAWRLGHAITGLLRRIALRPAQTEGALARARARLAEADRLAFVRPEQTADGGAAPAPELAARLRRELGPPPSVELAPVWLLVCGPGARETRRRQAEAIAAGTDYPGLVATDGGDARDEGALVLVCAPGVRGIDAGWLRELVAARATTAAAATPTVVGATGGAGDRVLACGVAFRTAQHAPAPRFDEHGRALWEAPFGRDREVVAGGPACLLLEERALRAVGGIDPVAPDAPTAIADLSLRLRAAGLRIAGSGRSVVALPVSAEPPLPDARHLLERWGPALRRRQRLALLEDDAVWAAGAAPCLGLAAPVPAKLEASLRSAGFAVTALAADGDVPGEVEFLAGPAGLVEGGGLDPRVTAVAVDDAPDPAADGIRGALIAAERARSWCIKIGAPDRTAAERWGDLHFARAVARELRRRGERAIVQARDEWNADTALDRDVVVHLRGLGLPVLHPGQTNVAWCISHPDALSVQECDAYDLVLVASEPFAEAVRARTRTPVAVLEQATDPDVFHPDPDPALAHDLVYVANSRGVMRPIVRDLLPTTHDLAIWGANWEGMIDRSQIVGERIRNDELRRVYSSAGIVLADHWDDMRERGFVSNRIYDALGCGAVVISDAVDGIERFGDAVAVYRTADELTDLIDTLLADPEERRRRGAAGIALIGDQHTFARRVDELIAHVERHTGASTRSDRLLVGRAG